MLFTSVQKWAQKATFSALIAPITEYNILHYYQASLIFTVLLHEYYYSIETNTCIHIVRRYEAC